MKNDEAPLIILEYCLHGNLREFLRTKRDIYEPKWMEMDNIRFTITDLANFALQVAKGMEFLIFRKVCDICLRVSRLHGGDLVKITMQSFIIFVILPQYIRILTWRNLHTTEFGKSIWYRIFLQCCNIVLQGNVGYQARY